VNGLSVQAVTIKQLGALLIPPEKKIFLINFFLPDIRSSVAFWRVTRTTEYGQRAVIPHAEHDLLTQTKNETIMAL